MILPRKSEQRENVLRRDDEQFGKVPYAILGDRGGIKAMRSHRSDALVYLALAIHVDGDDMTCYPSVEKLAKITGMSERTIRRSRDRLERRGLVSVEGKGGRNLCNRYTLETTTNPDSYECPGITSKGGQPECPGIDGNPDSYECPPLGEKPGHLEPETRTSESETRTSEPLNPDTQGGRGTEEQQNRKKTAAASGCAATDAAAACEDFIRGKYGESVATRCRPHLDGRTVDELQQLAERADGARHPGGWFIDAVAKGYDVPQQRCDGEVRQTDEQRAENVRIRVNNSYGMALAEATPDECATIERRFGDAAALVAADPLDLAGNRQAAIPAETVSRLLKLGQGECVSIGGVG